MNLEPLLQGNNGLSSEFCSNGTSKLASIIHRVMLARNKNGALDKHDSKKIAAKFGLHVCTVHHLWYSGKQQLAQGTPDDVSNRKGGTVGHKPTPVDLEQRRHILPLKRKKDHRRCEYKTGHKQNSDSKVHED